MTRTYAREEIKWDLDTLRALAALEPPQATYFEKADRWVVKQDGASFAVRPEQIVEAEQDYNDGAYEAEMAYERYLEDGGPHAAAIAAEDEIEREREAHDPGLQWMRAQREDFPASEPRVRSVAGHVHFSKEADDLIARFTR